VGPASDSKRKKKGDSYHMGGNTSSEDSVKGKKRAEPFETALNHQKRFRFNNSNRPR